MRNRLYQTALKMIARQGYQSTTLRDLAAAARVSPGLFYKYFPSKRAVVLALYDDLSATYASGCARLPPGPWRSRFLFALRSSLAVLATQRRAIRALVPTLIQAPEASGEGLFSSGTAFSRNRVQAVFAAAVSGASDAPEQATAGALGRVLYLVHLAVLLFWTLDQSPRQRATSGLLDLLERLAPVASLALRLPSTRRTVLALDLCCCEALIGGEAP